VRAERMTQDVHAGSAHSRGAPRNEAATRRLAQ
jgi:hypothetical protein